MSAIRITLILAAVVLATLLAPSPGPALADGILPDGCRGNLNDNQIIVYYFHRKFRCQSCEILESTLQTTLEVTYSDHFGAGKLAMCVVNVDDPENRHYLEQFQILSNSVIIVEKKKGVVARFKNLDGIWEISENREAINDMLLAEVDGFLPES